MDNCYNMIQNVNLRKMWKYVRGLHLKRNRRPKLDSDSVLREMRRHTDMEAHPSSPRRHGSLDYRRDAGGEHHVHYMPLTWKWIMQHRQLLDCRADRRQSDFHDLLVEDDGLDTLDLSSDVTAGGISMGKILTPCAATT